jgi:ligand-binding sensor protein
MNYKLVELLDVPKLQGLMDSLDELYSIPSAIIDMEGNILTGTSWQDICSKFHRANPESEKECIKSDTYIVGELSKGNTQVVYKCPQGLVDTATPIMVEGKHLGNAFTGQFFLESPSEEQFRKLAKKYGFDEPAYIKAMKKVPIITEDKHKKNLKVLTSLTQMLAEQGLKQKRQLEVEEALRESKERYRDFIDGTDDLVTRVDGEGNLIFVNHMAEKVFGITCEECIERSSFDFVHPDDTQRTKARFSEKISNKEHRCTLENRQYQ